MVTWVAKAVVQKTTSLLPDAQAHAVNAFFQRRVTKGALLSDRVLRERILAAAGHASRLHEQVGRQEPVVELGTGWYPVVPLSLRLCGFADIRSVDVIGHCTPERTYLAARRIAELHVRGELRGLLPNYDEGAGAWLSDVVARHGSERLDAAEIGLSLTVGDARHLPWPNGSIASVISNNVLEHIYPDLLLAILRELHRVLAPDGTMSHLVDLSDHFSHQDPGITPYNFLRFSDRAWRLIDNSIQPQSRLRVDDYEDLLRSAGFDLTWSESRDEHAVLLDRVPLSPRFAAKPKEVTAVTQFEFSASPAA